MKPRRVAISLRCSSFIVITRLSHRRPVRSASRNVNFAATTSDMPANHPCYRSLRLQRREQRVEPEFEYGVVVSGGLERLHQGLIGPFVVPQRGILFLVFGT